MASMLNSSPKYDQKYIYKKSSYHYSNADGNGSVPLGTEQNVNQLDVLLEDLKNEREQTRDKDVHSSLTSYKTIEPTGTVTRTTRIVKSHNVPLDVGNTGTTEYKSLNRSGGLNTTYQDIVRNDTSTYNSSKSISGNANSSNHILETSNISHSENNVLIPSLLQNDATNLTVSDNILPPPGTKVTTTVRTYTYEIPADATPVDNKTLLYKKNIYNSSKNEYSSESNLPPTVVYTSESYNTLNGPRGTNKPVGPTTSNRIYEINDTQEYRTQRTDPIPVQPTTNTIIYKINKTEHNTSNISGTPLLPYNSPNQTLLPSRPQQSPPQQPGPSTSTYYFKESTNTVNTLTGHPGDNLPPNVTIEYPVDTYGPQNPPSTVTYNYSSTSSNTLQRPNYDSSPSSQPPPFPVDGVTYPDNTNNPPAKLNELLDSFGSDNVDSRSLDATHRPKREVETALATTNQQVIPSVNKAGPAVYYPPGHEWLSKKEESAAGYSASGRYAKASGMYEYESGAKSKSSSKSGAAVVPVCLPLCCAMPCSIM